MSEAIPPWLRRDPWLELHPPAAVLVLGEMPRAPEKLLAATRALCVTIAPRYQPTKDATYCNVNTSDAMQILRAPLPHVFDLSDGRGARELTANDTFDGLQARKFAGWSKLGTMASEKAVIEWVSTGRPAIAIWKNLSPKRDSALRALTVNGRIQLRPGHVNPVVPTPPGRGGVHVTGAGGKCVQECPIQFSFGNATSQVEFWGHE